MLRIIAGKHRGRRIDTRKGKEIRPTTGRAREALFNILSHGRFGTYESSPILDKRVADLFCGTGAFGLEALSRGAGHVVFVDQDPESLSLARRNTENFKESEHANFVRSNSSRLPRAQSPCHLVFLDPPYGAQLVIPTLKSLVDQGWLQNGTVVIAEHEEHEKLELIPPGYEEVDTRQYGRAVMSIWIWKDPA